MARARPIGANEEADKILDWLPRATARDAVAFGKLAYVYIDDSGRLAIMVPTDDYGNGGGLLTISERDLAYVHGDEDPFMLDKE